MKTDQEIVDSRVVLRLLSGALAAGGATALGWRAYQFVASTAYLSWLEMLTSLGAIYGIYLLGYFALKGKLPFEQMPSGNA